ncbi:MAG TPA: MobF family relaxase [Pyrinomonadaceae bacterium]|jgi:conjugative relaxase-like TrwC/TraI family protein|nr:MobF family relaxase [Pyrinomonadaceae bacterium]
MMTMSNALSAGQANTYYQQDYANKKENYYSERGEVNGNWIGQLAEEWGLTGEVTSEQYERLVAGQDPHTGEQLIRFVPSREAVNNYGEEITTSEHRAGWDATFSAPKSVSLAALVGDDERVRVAHRESVEKALEVFEAYMQARGGGNKPAITTGKMIAAQFEHTAARPDHETGYAAPQLHTHVVIMNMTKTEQGEIRSVQPLELYRTQQYATATYRTHLAEKLQTLGYQIEVDQRTGAPEIKGFSKEYLQEASPRREEVKKEAQEMKERLEREGAVVRQGAGLNQAAARTNRLSKRYDHAQMRQRALEMDARYDNQAKRTVREAIERGGMRLSQDEITKRAQEAVTFARDNATEREAVTDMRKVMADALRRNIGLTTYQAVATELHQRIARGEFVEIIRERKPREATTQRMLEMETRNIQTMLDGQERQFPIVANDARRTVDTIAERQQLRLNDNQRTAVEQILTSRDQIIGLQGGAGTGKTTALSVLREAAEKEGYEVRGFAPTTRATKQLGESGIQSETLQKFIRRRPEAPEHHNRLFVLDESSLASTRNLHKFFARIDATDKVLLVGDSRQHQAVEAGTPFEQFQKHGMTTIKLSEIVRQRKPELRRTVERLSAREMREAIDSLERQGRIVEIVDTKQRVKTIASAYCKSPANTLVVSPRNRERVQLNSLIHRQLQRDGNVSRDDHQMIVYVNRQDMTGTERTFANAYVPGDDIIRYNRASKVYGVEVGDYGLVTAKNHKENEITVHLESGRELTYNPQRLSGVSVYREAEREFAEGDRIQFRAPFTEKRIANGELATIAKIGDEELTVKLDSGREVSFEEDHFRHIDHGYAVTSHSSQGTTVDRVLINADTSESRVLLNDRMGYVAVSRAREDAIIYTNSFEELRGALDRRVDKEMAVEAVHQADQYKHDLKDQQNPYEGQNRESLEVDQGYEQDMNDESRSRAAEAIEIEEMEFELA